MANNVEKAILKATKIRRKKKEDEQDLLRRAVEQVNELPEEAFDDLPEAAQLWYNAAATAYEEDETIPGFDDPLDDSDEDEEEEGVEAEEEESEDDDADEDEEESEEEAEEEADEDEDEAEEESDDEDEEEEEEEEPAPKKGRKGKAKAAPAAAKSKGKTKGKAKAAEQEEADEDEDEEEAKPKAKKKRSSGSPEGKPAVTGRIIELLVEALPKQPTQEAVTKTLRKEGYTVSDNTIGIQLSFVRRVLGHLQTMGKLKTK